MVTEYRSYDELPLVLTVEDLMPILLIGRNAAYELVRSGVIESFRIGKQIRITKESLIKYLQTIVAVDAKAGVRHV